MGQDLLGEVPREEQDDVGLVGEQVLGRVDEQVGAGRVAPLLDRRAIDDVVELGGADPAVREEGRALRRRAVGGNALTVALEPGERGDQIALELRDPRAEIGVVGGAGLVV